MRNSMTPIIPKIMPPMIVAMPTFSKEVFSLESWISANPKINAAKVVRIYDKSVRSFDMNVLSSSNFIIPFFFIDFILMDCY